MRPAPEYFNPGAIRHWADTRHKLDAKEIETAADYCLWLQERAIHMEQEFIKANTALKDAETRAEGMAAEMRLERIATAILAGEASRVEVHESDRDAFAKWACSIAKAVMKQVDL